MRVMEGSGQGDVNITGDERDEEVPGNEKTSRRYFPVKNSTDTTWYLKNLMDHSDDWLIDYKKNLDQAVEDLKNSHFPEQQITHYTTEFKPHIDMPEPTSGYQKLFGGSGIFLLLAFLIVAARRWYSYNRNRPVLLIGAGLEAIDQHLERDMRPPAQGEAVPPYIEAPPPYSDCSDHPSPCPKDTEQLIYKNSFVETGFTNETTTHSNTGHVETEILSENGRKVEEQGTRSADGRDSVVYVDEKSTSVTCNQN